MVAGSAFQAYRKRRPRAISLLMRLLLRRGFLLPCPSMPATAPGLHRHLLCSVPLLRCVRPARETPCRSGLASCRVFSISLPATILVSLDRMVLAPTRLEAAHWPPAW
jgi:hypothetical protein